MKTTQLSLILLMLIASSNLFGMENDSSRLGLEVPTLKRLAVESLQNNFDSFQELIQKMEKAGWPKDEKDLVAQEWMNEGHPVFEKLRNYCFQVGRNEFNNVFGVEWSPDGLEIGIIFIDRAEIWDMQNNELLQSFENVVELKWSPDSLKIGITFKDRVDIWDMQSNELLQSFVALDWLFWVSDSKWLGVIFEDRRVGIYNKDLSWIDEFKERTSCGQVLALEAINTILSGLDCLFRAKVAPKSYQC